jgi:hypothetical protein
MSSGKAATIMNCFFQGLENSASFIPSPGKPGSSFPKPGKTGGFVFQSLEISKGVSL